MKTKKVILAGLLITSIIPNSIVTSWCYDNVGYLAEGFTLTMSFFGLMCVIVGGLILLPKE